MSHSWPDAYATGQKMLIKVKEQIEEMILKSQGSDRPLPHIPNHAAVETACKPRLRLMSRYGQIAAEAPVQLHPQTGGAQVRTASPGAPSSWRE